MPSDNFSGFNPKLGYILESCTLIVKGQYREALSNLKRGLEENFNSPDTIETQQLIKQFLMLVETVSCCLEESLDVLSKKRVDQIEEPLCSFCAKKQFQVNKLIAGYGGFICNECIDACSRIIAEGSEYK